MSADATWEPEVARRIRAGVPPSPREVAGVTGARSLSLGEDGVRDARRALGARVLGLGPLEALVADETVTDVLVNGNGTVWVDRGEGVVPAGVRVDAADLRPLATRLAGLARRRLDDARPWVDGLLPGGVRLHALLPPLVDDGPHLSLRVARHQPAGVAGLEALGAVDAEVARVLRRVVRGRHSFLVTGGTGTGKTTVLGALIAECDPGDRIVVVEDVRELEPGHPHVVRLQGRGANVEGVGEVTMVDLVRQALRMRPDRLVVGEVRGGEVRELLSALNTGHEGGAGTVHANSVTEVPARVEALGALAGMPRAAVHAQLRGAVRVVLGMGRVGGRRIVCEVGVVDPSRDGAPVVLSALTSDGERSRPGPARALLDEVLGEAGP
ncbi:MAG TPA: TadA family conjugal transfer-associated ATPase [Dermatophilaceae bacterium]|nr:TadA family conjugal transfer-associated ATPase [Dermatophilaceae bacterium]